MTVNLNSFASLLLNKTPQITSGDKFSLSDGFYTRIFEFVPTGTAANDGQILPDGNVAILFSSTDSPATVATNMLKAINSQTSAVFRGLGLDPGLDRQRCAAKRHDHEQSDQPVRAQTFVALPIGANPLGVTPVKYDNRGDVNPVRDQGEVIIANNDIQKPVDVRHQRRARRA